MSDPLPISAVDITGYILLGTKKLNIRVTLDDIELSEIDSRSETENETEDEPLTDENDYEDELADEDAD
ncbi:MAG: hypothetical protein QOC83_7290, partial [Pseudonocardiales bacterium]|nr:hypothetical protein [Pseudonocardiales bacterium]